MEMLGNIGVFSLLALLVQVIILGIAYLLFRRKMKEPLYRIMTIACALGNCAFFGIPILEALYPETASGLLIYTSVYAIIMNVIGWTIGAAIISQNLKYVSVKKVLLNPATVALVLAVPFFVFEIPLPESLDSMISLIGRMATPISMLIMGMRLATTDLKRLFTTKQIYIAIFMKQFAMALVCLLLVAFLPVDGGMKAVLYIICCCPVASVVLNFSEILGEGQKEAASAVLLSTLFSIVTLPIMVLLLPA